MKKNNSEFVKAKRENLEYGVRNIEIKRKTIWTLLVLNLLLVVALIATIVFMNHKVYLAEKKALETETRLVNKESYRDGSRITTFDNELVYFEVFESDNFVDIVGYTKDKNYIQNELKGIELGGTQDKANEFYYVIGNFEPVENK